MRSQGWISSISEQVIRWTSSSIFISAVCLRQSTELSYHNAIRAAKKHCAGKS